MIALHLNTTLEDAVALMCRHERLRLLVLDDSHVVGFVTQRDIARCITFQVPWTDD